MLNYGKKILQFLLPHTCFLCKFPSDRPQDLCSACLKSLPILPQSCPRCAKTLWNPKLSITICKTCRKKPPPFEALYALFSYESPITKLIMELKFHDRLVNAQILGELMAEAIQEQWYHKSPLPDCILPVPLHPKRLRERGYNQALEIARPIAKALKLPIETQLCVRIKHTLAQAQLSRRKRRKNIKNAFAVHGQINNRHIAVLDDVITTGQTLNAICTTLRKAGARQIDVWCCARTLRT